MSINHQPGRRYSDRAYCSIRTVRGCGHTTAVAIPTFMRQAMAGKPLTVFGNGSQTRSFCYVEDLIRGLILLAESGEHTAGKHR